MEPRHLRLVEDRAEGYIGEGFLIALGLICAMNAAVLATPELAGTIAVA